MRKNTHGNVPENLRALRAWKSARAGLVALINRLENTPAVGGEKWKVKMLLHYNTRLKDLDANKPGRKPRTK